MKNNPVTTTRDRSVWLFNAGDAFIGNPKWLFLYVTLHRNDIEAHWICDDPKLAERIRSFGFKATTFAASAALQRRAGVFVVNQVKEHIGANLTGISLLNLWHGVGVKSIERGMNEGYLRERIAKKYVVNNQAYRDTQLFLVTSPEMEDHFTKYIGLDNEVTIRGAYPQNIYRKRFGRWAGFDHDIRGTRGLPASTRIAMFSPTPRRQFSPTFLHDALPDIPRLIERLKETNTLLIVKMHPHMTDDPVAARWREQYAHEPNLLFWDNRNDVYEILEDIDLAIVDYSSILYDQLASGTKNVIRYAFDLEDGRNAVLQEGTDYLSLSCGTLAKNFDALLDALGDSNEVPKEELARLHDYFWAYSEPDSMETIVDSTLRFTPRHVALPVLHTFDVFDTVIHRLGVEPMSVLLYVHQRLKSSGHPFPSILMADFPVQRKQAEASVREFHRKDPSRDPLDYEVTLDEILAKMADVIGLDDEQTSLLREWELEGELLSVVPDTQMIGRVKSLLARGETVALISDMYLPREHVATMLAAADPVLATLPLYLSNHQHAQKTTKTLFLRVYDDIDYDFAYWNHTGDSKFADETRPRELGIRTHRIPATHLSEDEKELVSDAPTFDAHLVAGLLRKHRLGQPSSADAFAFRRVALYLVPYVSWVVRDAVRRGYETLYFISRDGHHMRPIADVLIKHWNLPLKTDYIFASRRVWRLASQADSMEEEFFSQFGNFAGVKSLESLLKAGRIEQGDLARFAPHVAARISSMTAEERNEPALLREIIQTLGASDDYHLHMRRIAEEDRRLAVAYLDSHVDTSAPYAFVEYWGRGYTQDCLVRIMDHNGNENPVPFYYARSIYPTLGRSVRHNFTMAHYSLLFIEAIFANLPHGTVEAYAEEQGAVVPVTSPREYDAELLSAVERSVVEFAAQYAELPVLDRDRLDRDLLAFAVKHFQQNHTEALYVRHLAPLHDSIEVSGTEREFAPRITLVAYISFLRGKKLGVDGAAWSMALSRSSRLVRRLDYLQRRVGFRRIINGMRASLRARR